MNHFLKPIGHCLTTAVMTSAMLRAYSLPVEAAPPPDAPADSQAAPAEAQPSEALSVTADLQPSVAPPEVIAPIQAAPIAPPPATAPEPIAVETSAPVQPAQKAAAAETPQAETAKSETQQETAQPETAQPETAKSETPQPNSSSASKPEATAPTPNLAPNPASPTPHPKATAASPQKAESNPARTIAGMRQIVEKRLATIVERDKASREAQWQQMLIQTALQYAWTSRFEQARQIAKHPALPVELQTELLGKITAIEIQSSQLAQLQRPGNPLHASKLQQPAATGRNVPTGYSAVGSPSYAGISLGSQCPAIGSISTATTAAKPIAPAASKSTTVAKKGIPAFVPSLSHNLATRLVQLSQQSQVAQTQAQKQGASNVKQPIVTPQLFVGVASDSVTATPTAVAVPPVAAPSAVSVNHPITHSADRVQPVIPAVAAATVISSNPATLSNPVTPSNSINRSLMGAATATTIAPTASSSDSTLDQLLNSTFYSFQQFGVPFAQLMAEPFNLSWWRGEPEATETAPTIAPIDLATDSSMAELGFNRLALEPVVPSQFLRNARKLSIPNQPKLPTPTKATKAPTYDVSALIAASCADAQLTHYESGSYVVNPTTSKQQGWVNLMFPLPIPAAITSAFGWRIHPISGSLSFHAGIDIGAPMGTPVMASQGGKVVAADYMGGYGLAVVVESDQTHQRNLYGHLSGVAVQPGVQVAQGAILGWVGSTGNSTGPHLHLESQVRTEAGWTAIDPLATAALTVAKGE